MTKSKYRGLGPNLHFNKDSASGKTGRSTFDLLMTSIDKVCAEIEAPYKQLALTDELTGLTNRRFFNNEIESIHHRAKEKGPGYALLVLDLDHFKKVNDMFGHDAGDVVLKHVASIMKDTLGEGDDIARGREESASRTGGEEFVLLLPTCSSEDYAAEVAEKIRYAIEISSCTYEMNTLKITASIGVCFCAPESNMSHHEVFKMADDAAYASKNKGRNQVTVFKELLRENPTQHPSSKEYTP